VLSAPELLSARETRSGVFRRDRSESFRLVKSVGDGETTRLSLRGAIRTHRVFYRIK
jgi:hypothetical protein